MIGGVLFALWLVVLVMVHESGHFLVAKRFDFKASKFFFGFGPTLWSRQRGETEYGVKALPLGGFVKIDGMNPYEEVPEADRHRSYPNKPAWQRALVLVAGSATHFVLAFVLLFFAAMLIGHPTLTPVVSSVQETVGDVETPAARAGLRAGDQIVAVDGRATETWDEVRARIRAQDDLDSTFVVERDGERRSVTVQLCRAVFGPDGSPIKCTTGEPQLADGQTTAPFLGVAPSEVSRRDDPLAAAAFAAGGTWDFTVLSVTFVDDVFRIPFQPEFLDWLTGESERDLDSGVGPVGGARLANEVAEQGEWFALIETLVAFTIVVGVLNLLPLPPLDGGHLAVVAWESLTGRKVDVRKLVPVAAVVIAYFAVLFVAMVYLDIANPLQLPN